MEKLKDLEINNNNINIDQLFTDIENCIQDICFNFNIEDLKQEKQQPFNAVLYQVGKKLFNNDLLKDKNNVNINNIKGNQFIECNCNRYNYKLISVLCDYYINDLCFKYQKLVGIEGFCLFINVSQSTIYSWQDTEATSTTMEIFKKLRTARENCLKYKCYDSNNIIGTISIGNTEYSWNMPGVKNTTNIVAISSEKLPQLTAKTP